MVGEPGMRDPGPFMVPRDDEYRDTRVRDLEEGLERLEYEGWGYPGPVEDVAPVDDQVHLSGQGRCKSQFMVGEKIVSPAPTFYSRSGG